MKELAGRLFVLFAHLGGFGLVFLGVLDSSFLVMPLGNDLLIIAMTVRSHQLWLYYAAMATTGSVLGCLLMDVISRKGGEELLKRRLSPRRLQFVERRVKKNAGWALGFAALMPPPFPFTPFIIAAAALDYPRRKLLGVIAATRFLRFGVEAYLATVFGRRLLHWASLPAVEYGVVFLIVVSIGASVLSVYSWVKKSKRAAA